MNNVNFEAVKQMAATCAAMQMLLSGGGEISDLRIFGGASFPRPHSDQIARTAKPGCLTLIVAFKCNGSETLVDSMLLLDASSNKKMLWIGLYSFVQSADGKFALRLAGRGQPTEWIFNRRSNRLVSRPVKDDTDRGIAELRGLQALLAKAATPECQELASHLRDGPPSAKSNPSRVA